MVKLISGIEVVPTYHIGMGLSIRAGFAIDIARHSSIDSQGGNLDCRLNRRKPVN